MLGAEPAMVATLGGLLALPLGLLVLLLPLLATELSRPRDSAWGAVVLLLGLVLVTSADRLTGAPMLGVVCGGLLIGRLSAEVGQARWRQLTSEEQQRLGSLERWTTSFSQLGATLAGLGQQLTAAAGGLSQGLGSMGGSISSSLPAPATEKPKPKGKAKGKRWVRPEPSTTTSPGAGGETAAPPETTPSLAETAVGPSATADPTTETAAEPSGA
jgi:isoleucyl-tRNA synthetase